jgi:hypothetical protein
LTDKLSYEEKYKTNQANYVFRFEFEDSELKICHLKHFWSVLSSFDYLFRILFGSEKIFEKYRRTKLNMKYFNLEIIF